MAIITFWNDGREQSGKTLTSVAVATRMAIERNSRILLISTSVADPTMQKCFWEEENKKSKFFDPLDMGGGKDIGIAVESGIEGLLKLETSNKLTPSIISDYTKVIFKNRLDVLTGPTGIESQTLFENEQRIKQYEGSYLGLIKTASQYYDIVIVDLDKMLSKNIKQSILEASEVNVFVLAQKSENISKYQKIKAKKSSIVTSRCVPVIGKYMNKYKYNSKNIARAVQEKKELDVLPYNLLYMAASEEATVVDLMLKLKNVKDATDENYIFMQSTLNLMNNIFKKLQEVQMKMG